MNGSSFAPGLSTAVAGVNRGWLLLVGALMIVLGVIGLGMTYALTNIILFWIGILAAVAGLGQLLDAFHHKKWSGLIWHVIVGLVYIAFGAMLAFMPAFSAFWLTLVIAVSLMVTGLVRVVSAFRLRGHRGLQIVILATGLVSIGLGFYIYQLVLPPSPEVLASPEAQIAWRRSWQWVIGLFVAIELIMEGVALVSIALSVRRDPEPDRAASPLPG
ncbi:HdeD family acid-resistance protein [Sphingosinicella terrae]|uniref:HdeD family acid-resistance protein n=1 Tax=Sphingosinicella terrae TaxID=2172047 RepID=UPI0013B35B04|nr:DUF308 domain-containing protein [Sphingosinicella terrae]